MDTAIAYLPSEIGTILRENIAVIEIVSIFSIGAYNALETVFITFDTVKNYRSLYFWSILLLILRSQSADIYPFLNWMDLVICGFYIYEAIRALKCIIRIRGRNGRKVIIYLLWVNVLVVALNILLLLTEYKLHDIQVSFKTVVYSIKLKLEFSMLNRLR
ncbi:hypothetical protein DTO003C3_9381 [Penicillium roqueforti]|nr:hypothetical protein DTO003C3_9381 [Penicillium roqueforti]